jgi:hypothetical protein
MDTGYSQDLKSKWMEVSSHSLPVTMEGGAMFLLNYTL